MKATMSQDGKLRFDARITIRIGFAKLLDGLGWSVMREFDYPSDENYAMAVESALTKFKSRKALMEAAVNAIRHDGDNAWTWSDSIPDKLHAQISEQGRVLIRKKFPELTPDS